jgi:hypothetical protein
MNDNEECIMAFEKFISDMKKIYLNQTDNISITKASDTDQDSINVLHNLDAHIDNLYTIIFNLLHSIPASNEDSKDDMKSVSKILEQNSILSKTKSNPSLKNELIAILNRDLKEYPYTPSEKHTKILGINKV